MKLSQSLSLTFAMAASVALLTPAHAAVIVGASGSDSFGSHAFSPSAATGFGFVEGTNVSFSHQWLFNITTPAVGSGSVVANSNFLSGIQTVGITGGVVSLYRDLGALGVDASDTQVGTSFTFSSLLPGSEIYPGLTSGNYYYNVSGITSGTSSGNYVLNSTMEASVPSPAGLALLAIGGVAFFATRKKM
jgi:hypothetical protein